MFGLHIVKKKKRIERAPARMSAKCETSAEGARLHCAFIHDSCRTSMAVGGDDYRLEFTLKLSGLLEL